MKKIVFTLLLLFNISLIYAQADSLIFKKVRDVVGEVKYLKLGSITIETDFSEKDFVVEWDKVKEFYSDRIYIITLSEGERYTGKINTDPGNKSIVKITMSDEIEIKTTLTEIVDFKSLDPGFWDQLSASIDLGYSFTKANHVSQITLRSQIGYLTENWITNFSFDATRNAQDSIETTQRTDAIRYYSYFLVNKWFVFGAVSFLQNDEQKLELRSKPKAGIGKYVFITNHVYLSLIVSRAWNNESYMDPSIEGRSSAVAFMGTEFNIF